jgi:uncharacterized protein (TIGR02001 family)
VPLPGWPAPASHNGRRVIRWTVAVALSGLAQPAAAQVAVEIGLQSDYRFRGYSLTDEDPVGTLAIGYDDPSGAYAGGSAVGTFDDGEPAIVALQGTLGYATRLSPSLSVDVGVTRTEYTEYVFGRDVHYTEVHVGLASSNVTARVRYSPDYYRSDWETLYVELDGGFEVARDWFVNAHAGQLTYLGDISPYLVRHSYDWRLGGSHRMGAYGVHLELSGRVAQRPPALVPANAGNNLRTTGTAVVLGVTRAF